jgi:hypothetical protein
MAARRWLDLPTFALLLLVAGPRPSEAQTTNRFAGTFDELFSNGGKVTPIFTRPDAPAPPTSIDVSPPPNTEHQRAAEAGKQEGPASDLEERLISPAQAASPPAQSRSEALQPPSTPQVIAAVPTQRQAVIPENVQAGRRIAISGSFCPYRAGCRCPLSLASALWTTRPPTLQRAACHR